MFLRVHHVKAIFSIAINCPTKIGMELVFIPWTDVRMSRWCVGYSCQPSCKTHARPVPLVWSHDCEIWWNMSTLVFASPGKLNDCNTDIYTKLNLEFAFYNFCAIVSKSIYVSRSLSWFANALRTNISQTDFTRHNFLEVVIGQRNDSKKMVLMSWCPATWDTLQGRITYPHIVNGL